MTRGATDDPEPAGGDEERLVDRARNGDADAYGELVTIHQAAAFRVAFLLTGSAADAEDAAQEAFVKAYLALDRFRSGAPFRPWLLAIVGNEARNRRRAAGRREGLATRAIAAVRGSRPPVGGPGDQDTSGAACAGSGLPEASVSSPELTVLQGETRREVRSALAGLGEDERRVVACRYLLGMSEAETAAALGIPAGTAKSRLHRGLLRMRATLEATDGAMETGQ